MRIRLFVVVVAGLLAGLYLRSGDIVLTSTTTHRFEFQRIVGLPNADRTAIGKVIIVHRRYDTSDRDPGDPPKIVETETELTPALVAAMPDCAMKAQLDTMLTTIAPAPALWAYALTNQEFQAMLLEARAMLATNVATQ